MINRFFFPTISNSKLALIILLFGLFAGILIRMAMIFFFIEFDFTTGDAASYIEIARHISEFGIYGLDFGTLVYRPPMYPFFLYFVKVVTSFEGSNFLYSIIFIQIILSTYSVYLFYQLNQNFFSNKFIPVPDGIAPVIPTILFFFSQVSKCFIAYTRF